MTDSASAARYLYFFASIFRRPTRAGGDAPIVETIPGWTHDITNIGSTEMVVMLWANEIFDRAKPDTVAEKV